VSRPIKFLAGLGLLPLLAAAAGAVADATAALAEREHAFPSLVWTVGGAVVWLLCYALLPRPMRAYVLGHELTHVLWTWLHGGRAFGLRVGRRGGEVRVTRSNVWVSLAPYFFPFYTALVVVAWGAADLAGRATGWRNVALGLVGLTWTFHATFTIEMMQVRQPDLREHGVLFSTVIILLVNLAGVGVALSWVGGLGGLWWPQRFAARAVAGAGAAATALRAIAQGFSL